MERIDAVIQSYPWGSHVDIAQMMGKPTPTSHPWAEAWFGAHPLAPSPVVSGEAGAVEGGREAGDGNPGEAASELSLRDVIASNPQQQLGSAADIHDGQLPFLLKLLAADQPLSLQAHPTLEQAQEGYARENEAGLGKSAPNRNYKDPNHKPELIVALTEFAALAGFRPVEQTKKIFSLLEVPALDHYTVMLDSPAEADGLRALFTTWLTLPESSLQPLVEAVCERCTEIAETAEAEGSNLQQVISGELTEQESQNLLEVARTVIELCDRYPNDPGVLGALLLNRITLAPGEAIYMGAGTLHAYVDGFGVEIMANSDNVLRGGLTSKHVDIVELMRVLNFDTIADPVVRPSYSTYSDALQIAKYQTPAREFALQKWEFSQAGSATLLHDGPAIVLSCGNSVSLSKPDCEQPVVITPGTACWLTAEEAEVEISADGAATVFIATVPEAN